MSCVTWLLSETAMDEEVNKEAKAPGSAPASFGDPRRRKKGKTQNADREASVQTL